RRRPRRRMPRRRRRMPRRQRRPRPLPLRRPRRRGPGRRVRSWLLPMGRLLLRLAPRSLPGLPRSR
ncbi:hypothetical protein GGF32_009085, partial [Allomyces javanicus]